MKKRVWTSILFLVAWTSVLGGVYWFFADKSYSLVVATVYAVVGTVLFVFFLLVNSGFRSFHSEEQRRAAKDPTEQIAPRADLFHLGKEKQETAARWLLMTSIPFFFVLMADYIYLNFIFKG